MNRRRYSDFENYFLQKKYFVTSIVIELQQAPIIAC